MDSALLDILRCPAEHHAELTYDEAGQTLTCTECHRVFEIRDGVPVLLLDEVSEAPSGASETGPSAGKVEE
jgi:uncharacterized protein YbaR (Trm112 family)